MANCPSVWESASQLYCGFVRERGTLGTSATTPICARLSRSTNSLIGRVECPMVKNGCAICHFGLPAYAPKRTRLVQSHMIGLVALNFVLRVLLARVVDISFVIHILGVHLDNFPASEFQLTRSPFLNVFAMTKLARHVGRSS